MEGQYIPEGALGKVWRVLDRCIMFTTVVGSLASVMFIGAMFLNVIMRYVFSSPIWWFDEMIIALLVWYSALGTVVCYWTNEHAVIHFFLKFINRTGSSFSCSSRTWLWQSRHWFSFLGESHFLASK